MVILPQTLGDLVLLVCPSMGLLFFRPSLPVQDETPHLLKPELLPEAQYACVVSYIAVKFIYIHAPCGQLSGYHFPQTVPVHHRLPLS